MDQVIDRRTLLIDDPTRLAPPQGQVEAVRVDETAYLRANATRSTTFATGIADLTPGRPARLLDVVEGRSGTVLADGLAEQPASMTCAAGCSRTPRGTAAAPGIRSTASVDCCAAAGTG
jgi:hypothetical protein